VDIYTRSIRSEKLVFDFAKSITALACFISQKDDSVALKQLIIRRKGERQKFFSNILRNVICKLT
jgi:hypothetical protein